jgi:ABC-type dipeptide/oligopeptide/nickel transport system permease subunit
VIYTAEQILIKIAVLLREEMTKAQSSIKSSKATFAVNCTTAIGAEVGGEVELAVAVMVQELACIFEEMIGADGMPASKAPNLFAYFLRQSVVACVRFGGSEDASARHNLGTNERGSAMPANMWAGMDVRLIIL